MASVESLTAVLANPVRRQAFVDFCAGEHCAENVNFWLAVTNKYERCGDDDPAGRVAAASAIVRRFVRFGAADMVNMVDSDRSALMKTVQAAKGDSSSTTVATDTTLPKDLFADIKAAAFKDLLRDMFPRFLRSTQATNGARTSTASTVVSSGADSRRESTASDTSAAEAGALLSFAKMKQAVLKLRKKSFLGMRMKQRHSKTDLATFEALGALLRDQCVKAGFLQKRGDKHQSWKRRWCVLGPAGLAYFLDEFRLAPKGMVLSEEIIDFEEDMDEELGLRFTFGLRTKARVYCIQASSQRDRARWVAAITDTIPALKAASAVRASGPRVSGAGGAAGAVASQ